MHLVAPFVAPPVLSREKPAAVKKGIGVLDEEGRVLTLDYGAFYLVAVRDGWIDD